MLNHILLDIFDILLTRDLSRANIIDFNPYAPFTDSLFFDYEELAAMQLDDTPQLRVIDSKSHPAANRNAPANQHNMVPFEALNLSNGADIEEFSEKWKEQVRKSMDSDESE